MIGWWLTGRRSGLDPELRAARRHVARNTSWSVFWRVSAVLALPVAALIYEGEYHASVVVLVAALPGLALLAGHTGRRAAVRFDQLAHALPGDDNATLSGIDLSNTEKVDDMTAALVATVQASRRDAENSELERQTALERERLTAEGMASLFLRRVYAEERAMAILSAELHDTVAQTLLAAQFSAESGAPMHEVFAEIRTAERQLRGVLALTSPPELEPGLAEAVRRLCGELRQQFGLEVEVTAWPTDVQQIEQSAATTLYRFFQETLRNVVKHSGVLYATLALDREGEQLVARVSDAGTGFDPLRVRPTAGRHVGLYLMDDRARAVGGELELDSATGRGTVATIRVPLARRISHRASHPRAPHPGEPRRVTPPGVWGDK